MKNNLFTFATSELSQDAFRRNKRKRLLGIKYFKE